MQYLYHVLSLREPVFIRPAELGGIQQVFFINVRLQPFKNFPKNRIFRVVIPAKAGSQVVFPKSRIPVCTGITQ
jgi:hypothetical protein